MDSFIAWVGGKKLLRKDVVARFPKEFGRYIEVFGGAGWVLFYKERHANIEVFNDVNSELINLYRCIKFHEGELQKELEFVLNSRELFYDYQRDKGLTDIQRAARFFTVLKFSYGATGKTFGGVKKNVLKAVDHLKEIQKRLSNVVVENKDFESLIKCYDRPDSLFYLDPPYYKAEGYYTADFGKVSMRERHGLAASK